ncbi:hypothetical protein KM1_315890 [Entamoeba histolytica HM-3:IMSS]|uniref:Uncharacterized protein n=1 Tax=Entamoeba histolytica HM-3:IMSS TaxID=885315 RepID=M7W9X2_ENTHI|nr:hypothetical protein KM1_315890 [Entamoeba histolytica HM-3:IMSS]
MKFFGIVFLVFIASALAQSTGFWTPTLYKIRERLSEVAIRIDEVEDDERHYGSLIDKSIVDLKSAITKREKYTIGRRLTHLRAKLVVFNQKKLLLLRALKRIVSAVPRKFRAKMIRSLKIEKRFVAIRDIERDAKRILSPKKAITHKSSTKKTLKRLGHGIAKNVKTVKTTKISKIKKN